MAVVKKKASPGKTALRIILSGFFICVTIFCWGQIFKDVKTNRELHADLNEAEAELKALQAEKESLSNQKEKLSDVNYISSVARGKYLISTSSEQIYVLPSLDD